MAITVTPGITFQQGGGQEYTAAQMNSAFTDMEITGISRENMAATSRPVTVSASEPSTPQTGELWYDTNTSVLKVYDSSTNWQSIGPRNTQTWTARSTITAGDLVVIDTDNGSSVETTTTVAARTVAGVAIESATSGNPVQIQTLGVATINCTTHAVDIGEYLVPSATAGHAWPETDAYANEFSGGAFAIALTSKGAGSVGTVLAFLITSQDYGYNNVRTYATYSTVSAALTGGTWYDIPDAAVGASITTDGSSAMDVPIVTTRPNQLVTVAIRDMKFLTSGNTQSISGFRISYGAGPTPTTFIGGTSKHANLLPSGATAKEESFGCGAVSFTNGSACGLYVQGESLTNIIPTPGSHTIRLQFRAGVSTNYTITQQTTATLRVYVH